MRRLGYRAVDLVTERIAGLDREPVWQPTTRAELEARLREPPPERPEQFDELVRRLAEEILPFAQRTDHPRFFAFIPGCPTWPSVVGELIATGYNLFQGTWLGSAGPSEVELVVLDWFKAWLGYPDEAAGLLVSGGSEANLTALACARASRLGPSFEDAVVYVSSQAHSSVLRAARVLGFSPERVREVATDEGFRLRPDALAAVVAKDRAAGLRPFLVSANAGATNTGTIDPLPELANLCADHGLWLHVDGAYGGFAALSERGRALLRGIDRADSVTLDPHKWLFQPWGTGCLLVRDGSLLEETFKVSPDYLQDASAHGREVNFADRGIQLTRPARALKIWLSLRYFGVDAFRRAIDRAMDLALLAQDRIERSATLELLSPATLGIVCFRRGGEGGEDAVERLNVSLLSRLNESGLAHLSSTRLDSRYAIRLCVVNHRTRAEDVERVLAWLESG